MRVLLLLFMAHLDPKTSPWGYQRLVLGEWLSFIQKSFAG
jgi:hypothetical protein